MIWCLSAHICFIYSLLIVIGWNIVETILSMPGLIIIYFALSGTRTLEMAILEVQIATQRDKTRSHMQN